MLKDFLEGEGKKNTIWCTEEKEDDVCCRKTVTELRSVRSMMNPTQRKRKMMCAVGRLSQS